MFDEFKQKQKEYRDKIIQNIENGRTIDDYLIYCSYCNTINSLGVYFCEKCNRPIVKLSSHDDEINNQIFLSSERVKFEKDNFYADVNCNQNNENSKSEKTFNEYKNNIPYNNFNDTVNETVTNIGDKVNILKKTIYNKYGEGKNKINDEFLSKNNTQTRKTATEELKEWYELKEQGIISEEEFEKKKKDLLNI